MEYKRLYVTFLITVFVAATFYVATGQFYVTNILRDLNSKKTIMATRIASDLLEKQEKVPSGQELRELSRSVADIIDGRVTIINVDGRVLSDTDVPVEAVDGMDNHADRPEVIQASRDGVGISTRKSATIGRTLLYVAVPYQVGSDSGYVRLALYNDLLNGAITKQRYLFVGFGILGFCIVGIIGLFVLRLFVRELSKERAELVRARDDAEKASRAKSDFLSSMSHELRTPMNAILGFAQILDFSPKEPLSENQKASVANILKGGDHLMELINKVLELETIEAGNVSLDIDHVSTRDVIDHCLTMIQVRASREVIEITDQTVGTDLPLVWTDATRLTQALLNLLSNAVKYNSKGGKVTLNCEEIPGRLLRMSVTDTGTGIPVEKQDDLFKPFERLGREAGAIEGSGIGLTITKNIIELLGGQIGFESEAGKGSTFWVDIPISGTPIDINKITGKKHPVTGKKVRNRKDAPVHTILYIEDNPDNMRLMEKIVGNMENGRLLTAPTAELGFDLAMAEHPGLILMDTDLSGMNCIEAVRQLKNTKETKAIPVIAITSAVTPKEVAAGRKAGLADYIIKPINVATLMRMIEETFETG